MDVEAQLSLFSPPTKIQIKSAQKHQKGFAKWADSLVQKTQADAISRKAATSAGDAVRARYARGRRKN